MFGAESSIDLNVIRGNVRGAGISPAHDDSLYDIRFRGLLGYEFGAFMPFVSGGAVLNEGYMSGVGGLGNVPTWFGRNEKTIGYTVGGGLDYKFFPQQLFPGLPTFLLGPVTLRAEYLYQSLPSQTYAYGGQVYRTKSDGSFFRGALIYRFGDNPPRPYADTLGNVNWAGGYGGLFGAYAGSNVKVRVAGVGTRNIDSSGAAGGIYAGTNFMFNRLMLGFEGSTAYEDETGNRAIPIGPAGGTDNVRYRGYINADIRGRIGYAFGNFLPFLAAGYSFDRGELIDTVTGSQRGRVPLDASWPAAASTSGSASACRSGRGPLRLRLDHQDLEPERRAEFGVPRRQHSAGRLRLPLRISRASRLSGTRRPNAAGRPVREDRPPRPRKDPRRPNRATRTARSARPRTAGSGSPAPRDSPRPRAARGFAGGPGSRAG